MGAGALDRRIQFLRAPLIDDGFAARPGDYAPLGSAVWGSRQDIRDSEKAEADTIYGEVSCRFQIRSTSFSRTITLKDRLVEGGRQFEILGIKEVGRRDMLEITATARTDL